MELAGIYHRPESEMAFLYAPKKMRIRLRTSKDDIKNVELIHGDPYSLRSLAGIEPPFYQSTSRMKKILSDELYDYWQIEVTEPKKRLAYAFKVTDTAGSELVYTDRGFIKIDDKEQLDDMNTYFRMPFFQEIDMAKEPEWVRKTIWYQIFPERFANGDVTNDPQDTKKWDPNINPGRQDFYGGDLQGVLDHLDYLKELGINGIYFNPIFKAPSNHKYDTEDYYQIDPHFGDKKLFKELVKQAHKRGIRVMLDAVFNHIGDKSPQWQDVLKNGENSKYKDWFHINKFPATYTPTNNFEFALDATYDTFDYTPHMPKLNTANPEVQEYLLDIGEYWVKEFDIDAWRLDVANEIDHHFWREFHNKMIKLKPDFYILGEIWHTSQAWLNGDEFNGVMNYAYTTAILQHFIEKKLTTTELVEQLSTQLMKYRDQTNQMMFNVLDSHDTARIKTLAHNNMDLVRQIFTFTFLQSGTPSIYYGTEYGMTGENDPDSRKPMNWWPNEEEKDIFKFFQLLIEFRKKNWQLISEGEIKFTVLDNGLLKIERVLRNKKITGLFNTTSKEIKLMKKEKPIISQNYQGNALKRDGFVISKRKS
ncbi:glycoside hydrolase family 13 protein [Lactobacillus sp. PV012]|uniref:glycoside hydrolase family 13 protein n=1 Tax=Lactobacillus sp. PV012 TaxID=2594494 RepID=UPI002240088D|nr:glycoside hydrolase family 13 protein [Lactobacillus sp. PV012]QNQ81620.1 alpha-glycosidase [Lactobacillus sp. PV012]